MSSDLSADIMQKVKVGVIGLGYWGPNYVRNFYQHPLAEVVWCCDLSEKSLQKIHHQYPLVNVSSDYQKILADKSVDFVAIATPPKAHFTIGSAALKAGKHILLAKPLATSLTEAEKLLQLAKKKGLMMHSDLTYLYSSAVGAIKDSVVKDKLGKPIYFDSIRANPGPIRDDANVIWDLAPHDLAILDHLFGLKPKSVFATGSRHYPKSVTEELAHIVLTYPNNFVAHIHLSWLSPVKMRSLTVSGAKLMIHFDDGQPEEKIRIYDSQFVQSVDRSSARRLFYQNRDIIIPKLSNTEALYIEADELVWQILKNKISYHNALMSLRIIRILEACDRSLKSNKVIHF